MVLLAVLFVLGVGAAPLFAQLPPPPQIRLLEVDGVINPLSARYLERELEDAAASGATAVVLRLDTPGGLEPSMRVMVEAILGARLPVVAHVAPPGARAASAGMFLVLAAHVAAMAGGTNIGAAHPVSVGGQQPDTTLAEKMVSDAAALARAIAERRGRNAEWAELAVRRSVSITAQEALEIKVIDLVVDDLDALLSRLDGRRVQTAAGMVGLRTAGARMVERPMNLPERILHAIADPNIAYLLLSIGFIGIIAELYSPGVIFPGVTGVIALILAFVALGSLPVNWAGVVLLALGLGLFAADLATEGIGVLAVGGLVAFVLGSLMLYSPFTPLSPAMPEVRVSRWLIIAVAAAMAALLFFVGRAVMRPVEIEQAMTRQMSAERERRATVTRAMGEREATIRIAEGERQAAILRAEGAAQALLNVFEAARQIDSKTMALQYLDMLRTVGAAESTKLVVPAELMGLLRPFMEHHAAAAEAR